MIVELAYPTDTFPRVWRSGTMDLEIWRSITHGNEYGCLDFKGKRVVDIGAHIGAFSYLALSRGAAGVVAIEPEPQNYDLLCRNLVVFGRRARCYCYALAPERMVYHYCEDGYNTGGGGLIGWNRPADYKADHDVICPENITWEKLHTLCKGIFGIEYVDMMKIDAEGAEWYVFSRDYSWVSEIVGELHWHAANACEAVLPRDIIMTDTKPLAKFYLQRSTDHETT